MNGLIIDNFAGGGGASTGIEAALQRPIDVAINHSPSALAMHEANHPETRHLCEDVFDVKPAAVCNGRPVQLAWFSPDCKHFSKAKGGKPVSKKIRGLAWVAVRWAREVKPAIIILENVEEFQSWGPLLPDGKPNPKKRGLTFRRFVGNLRGLGYHVEWRELVAADYGAPTTRKRLFLIARCDGESISWPEQSHVQPGVADMFSEGKAPWRSAAECIDWSIPCPSIFTRKKPLKDNTLRRIAKGLKRFVIEAQEPFIVPRTETDLTVPYISGIDNKSSGDSAVWSSEEPLRTITLENRFALIVPHVTKFRTGAVGADASAPLPTITAGSYISRPGGDAHALGLVSAFIAKHYTGVTGQEVKRPLGTVTAVDHHSLVLAFMIKYYGCGNGQDVSDPLHTITTKDRLGLVTIHGEDYRIVDIGLRMLQPRELATAQGFPPDYILQGTKSSQVAMIGNSVCPPVAEALVRANVAPIKAEAVA